MGNANYSMNYIFTMTIIFHKFRPYFANHNYITLWFITVMKKDALQLLENAVKKYEKALGYNVTMKQYGKDNSRTSTNRTS